MFKTIEIWILYLVILLSIIFAIAFGTFVRQELVGTKVGLVSKSALFLAEIPVNFMRVLRGSGTGLMIEDRFPSQGGFDGAPNIDESYILLSRFDGDLEEGVVELVDLTSFQVLHTWNPEIDSLNDLVEKVDEFAYLERDKNNKRHLLKHPKLTKNGELLFHGEATPLRKIDACSKLIFQNDKDLFHHAIETDINGNIWASSHMYPQSLPIEKVGRKIIEEGGYLDDAIVQLSPNGEIIFEKSVSQILIDNGLEYLIYGIGGNFSFHNLGFRADPVHLNDIQPVDFYGEYWNKGDVFLSLRAQSMVLLYRPSTNEIIWKGVGPFFYQHDVNILDDHTISVFNNNAKEFIDGSSVDGNSEVLVYDFKTNEYSSYLSESLIKNDVQTPNQGRSKILPNGDLFIEESYYARTLYFNADGSIRWTHINRSKEGNVFPVGWSRILHTKEEIQNVKNFIENKGTCNE